MAALKLNKSLLLSMSASAAGYFLYTVPHTVFLNRYRKFKALYRENEEVPVNATFKWKLQKVMNDLGLPNDIKECIEPFNVKGTDVFHAGSTHISTKAIIGIPENFYFSNVNDVNIDCIKSKGMDIHWEDKAGEKLFKSLVLSESAQRFALAREILRIRSNELHSTGFSILWIMSTLSTLYCLTAFRLELKKAPRVFKRILFMGLTLFGITIFVALADRRSRNIDIETDNALSKLGPMYIRGGQEFYEKLVNRNIALRTLLGKSGRDQYTPEGNEKHVYRNKNIENTYRKLFFELKLEDMQNLL